MSKKATKEIALSLRKIPKKPGVYLMKAADERVLYVGKAKDLRVRLQSYFRDSSTADLDRRKQAMVRQVRDISTIVTGNELEALALEANLIKQHRPRFNVILRDDKSYPYLRLTMNETWPCLEVVRRPKARDGAMYFGPYVPSSSMYEAMKFIKRNFRIRPCRYRLDVQGKSRPCIQHQMGRCPAPCAGLVGRQEYQKSVREVIDFLKGRSKGLLGAMRQEMAELSEQQRYEEAAEVRDRIRSVERAWESQKVISPELGDIDVFGVYDPFSESVGDSPRKSQAMMAVVLFIRGGIMIGAKEFYLQNVSGAPEGELMHEMLINFYSKGLTPPPLILLPAEPDGQEATGQWLNERAGHKVSIAIPQRGKKHNLVKMASDNARAAFEARGSSSSGPDAVMRELALRLGIDETHPPASIGAFDISNLTGSDPVGGYIVWRDGDFDKDAYRHVRPKEVVGIDDYAMMRESVEKVLISGKSQPPDIIAIDGGKGHLEAVVSLLDQRWKEDEKGPPPMVIAIAKKPERVFMKGPLYKEPLLIEGRERSSVLLRRVRDEVHRFSVSFHKQLRGKRLLESPLQSIPGIGKKRRLALLKVFKGHQEMRQATIEELSSVEGMNIKAAKAVHEALGSE